MRRTARLPRPHPPDPPVRAAGAGRRDRRTARRTAGAVHLAPRAPHRRPRRRPRAHRDAMVARRSRPRADARLFPRREPRGVRVWLYREWPADPSFHHAGSCTACSHEQCRRVSRRDKKKAEIVLPQPDPSHAYAELAVTTNFSFLRGASHPEDLVRQAAALGLTGIGIADRNSVAGVVRAYAAAEQLKEEIRRAERREQGRSSGAEARRRRAARLRRRHAGHSRLSAEPRGMGPPHATAHRRQEPRRERPNAFCFSTTCSSTSPASI